jgi:hypothetical protein
MAEPVPYREAYPVGTVVCIADRRLLDAFRTSWKYHHKLNKEQLEFAGRVTTVADVGFYHGGDPIYSLTDVPGLWLEQCLRAAL